MAPQQTAKCRTALFGQFFTSSRKDSVANYSCIRTVFLATVRCSLQCTKCFIVPLVGGATQIANLWWKYCKTKNQLQSLCQILRMNTIEIVINSTHVCGHMHVTVSCRYALSPGLGRCFWFIVCNWFMYSSYTCHANAASASSVLRLPDLRIINVSLSWLTVAISAQHISHITSLH